MKYYKLIDDPEGDWSSFEVGKIYPNNFVANNKTLDYWLDGGNISGHLMQESEEWKYYLQERINPFKVGDKVKFVDRPELTEVDYGVGLHWAREENLDKTKVYEVSEKSGFDIMLTNSPMYYNSIQFELYNEESCGEVPERISFYVRYTPEFTEDVYNALMNYSKDVCKDGRVREWEDSYGGLRHNKYFVCDNYGLNSSSYVPNHKKCSYGVDNNSQGCAEELTVEEVKELIRDYLKPKEMNKPRPFIIEGSTTLIKAMSSDLLELGYTGIDLDSFTEEDYTNIQMNRGDRTLLEMGIKEFKELFLSSNTSYFSNNPSAERFSLPKDYTKALKFAKEQLNHPYWKNTKKFEVGDWILVLETGYNCSDHPKYNIELSVKKGDVVKIEQIERYKGFDVAICTGGEVIRIEEHPECFKTIAFEDAKERLLEIAKEKYPVGTWFKVAHCPAVVEKVSSHDSFENRFVLDTKDRLHINLLVEEHDNSKTDGASVYFNGTWAEIVENPQPEIEINGYKAKFNDYNKTVTFGCQTISREMAEKLLKLSEYSITLVDDDGEKLTKEIEQIVKYFNSLD